MSSSLFKKTKHKVGHPMNHNKNFHLARVFYCSGHTAFCLVSVRSCVTATVTITGLICSLLLLIDFESFDRLCANFLLNISVAKADDGNGVHFITIIAHHS